MKCDICGMESEFKAGFINQRRPFWWSRRNVCVGCLSRRRYAITVWNQVAFVIAGVIGYLLLWLNSGSTIGRILTGFFLVDVFLILSIVPHELGHAVVGRMVGWRVYSIVIGLGKRLFKFHLFGVVFSFHWLPVAGLTQVAPLDAHWFRLKRFLMVLAGPAVNLAIAVLIFLIWRERWRDFGFQALPRAAQLCFWANLFVMVGNLVPYQSKILNAPTDGMQLLKAVSRKQKDVDELMAARFAMEAMLRRDEYQDFEGALEWCNKGLALYPSSVHLLNFSGLLCLDQQNYSRAREIFLQLLPGETKPGITRYVILNNIAYVDAVIGDPALLPEADMYSNEAYSGARLIPAIVGTRGTVLVAMGQVEAGIKLLKESFTRALTPRSKAETACHLAIAHMRIGEPDTADKYLKLARQLDSQCRLIGRAEAECSGAKRNDFADNK